MSPSTRAICTWALRSTVLIACASQAGLTAVTVKLATTKTPLHRPLYSIAWTASAIDVLALAALLTVVLSHLRRAARKIQIVLAVASIVLNTLALVLTLYTLVSFWNDARYLASQTGHIETTRSCTEAGFVLWAVAVASGVVLHAMILWPENASRSQLPMQELEERPSPSRSVKRRSRLSLTMLSPPRFSKSVTAPSSPALSSCSSTPRSSARHSFNHAIRPMTSKTALLLRQSLSTRDIHSSHSGREASLEVVVQDDGFGSWDTSAVEEVSLENRLPRSTSRRLETIPGSRPVSPAFPLNGPFPGEDVPLPESPTLSPIASPVSPRSRTSSFTTFTAPQSPIQSMPDQSHIHPLFRSESPVPPPLASPGTVITASPYAGQVVAQEHQAFVPRKLHSANGYRPDSPRLFTPIRSRPGSTRSLPSQP